MFCGVRWAGIIPQPFICQYLVLLTMQPDWNTIDTVLLDMDGTVLDLHFDDVFWTQYVPECYAQKKGISLEAAHRELAPRFEALRGTLEWYCLDYWSDTLGLDIPLLKRDVAHLIGPMPGAMDFLHRVRHSGRGLWLVTNAHRKSLALKLEHTDIGSHFDQLVSSHDCGLPKEQPGFWRWLAEEFDLDLSRCLMVDDSLAVLDGARSAGVGQIRYVAKPSSQRPVREAQGYPVVTLLADLSVV